jgi:hypothetical protein
MSDKANVTTKTLSCTCTNEYQDKRYGKGRRVHNKGKREGESAYYKCTVCGKETKVHVGKETNSETKAKSKGK